MSSISVQTAEDLPYGPGNPDYERDGVIARKLDDEREAQPELSSSIAHVLVNKSALHAWTAHPRLNPNYRQEESAEFDYGRAAHSALLEGDESRFVVIEADDWRKKEPKELRDKARADGKMPMLGRQVHKVRAMVKAALEYVAASELAGVFKSGIAEESIRWQEGAALCRATPDWLTGDKSLVLDYKTTVNANPHSFVSLAIGYGYAMQEAFYRRGVKAVHGKEPRFVFLLQEKEPPFACSLVAFDPAMQEIGDRQAEYAIMLWKDYTARKFWPGYPSRIAHLEPPAWYLARAEEQSIDFANLDERMNP